MLPLTVGASSGTLEQNESSVISWLAVKASSLNVGGEHINTSGNLTDKMFIYGELELYT